MRKKLAILGSTGSIGTQALEVVDRHPDLYEPYVLTANHRADLLVSQARRYKPQSVVIVDETKYLQVKEALRDTDVQVFAGKEALSQVAQNSEVDVVLVALVGFAGLEPTLSAIEAGKTIALANKETLVVAGELVTRLATERRVAILPVDSEHSAIFQSLVGERMDEIEEIVLTSSGGPFRMFSKEELEQVSVEQAMRHPRWEMGAKITIDSATMMNKGFEVIEAKWLFGVGQDRIRVVVHPESIVHSAVVFRDGAVKAQLGVPDMRIPIQYALSYPTRLGSDFPRLDWYRMSPLTFEKPDTGRFPCLPLAYEALRRGGTAPCTMNAANEVANLAFREGRCPFTRIAEIIEKTMDTVPLRLSPTLKDYIECDQKARQAAEELTRRQDYGH